MGFETFFASSFSAPLLLILYSQVHQHVVQSSFYNQLMDDILHGLGYAVLAEQTL